jgi:hypothetical protein
MQCLINLLRATPLMGLLALSALAFADGAGRAAPIPEASGSTIGYPTPAAALDDLKRHPGVVIKSQNGWTVADDEAAHTIWSFTPSDHPAYPAVVKRQLVQQGGGIAVKMDVLCNGSKAACDDLVRSFQALNAQIQANLKAGR